MANYLPCVLVCGGRDHPNTFNSIFKYMDAIAFWYGGSIMLMTGACKTGADAIAEQWAKSREQIYIGCPAEWGTHGKKAGMKRNGEMASNVITQVDAVVVFQGGRGTMNMYNLAKSVMEPEPDIWLPDGEFWK